MKLLSTYRPTVPAVTTQDTARRRSPRSRQSGPHPQAAPAKGRLRRLQHQPDRTLRQPDHDQDRAHRGTDGHTPDLCAADRIRRAVAMKTEPWENRRSIRRAVHCQQMASLERLLVRLVLDQPENNHPRRHRGRRRQRVLQGTRRQPRHYLRRLSRHPRRTCCSGISAATGQKQSVSTWAWPQSSRSSSSVNVSQCSDYFLIIMICSTLFRGGGGRYRRRW